MGTINGKSTWPNDWIAWGINHYYDNPDAIAILTPDVLKQPLTDGRSVVVSQGKVTAIVDGDADIPQDGFLIHYGPNAASTADHFRVGDRVQYQLTYKDEMETLPRGIMC